MSISREEAIDFLKDKLGIEDGENQPLDLQFLNRIARCLQSELPFQNLLLYNNHPERRFPTAQEVVQLGMSLTGGICIHHHWFASILLEAIGYDLFTIMGTFVTYPDLKYPHPMIVVRGLQDPDDKDQENTLFLVDVGTGYPTPGCVPLHRLPFEFPVTTGFRCRFTEDDDFYYRLHRSRFSSSLPQNEDGWTKKVIFTLDSCEFAAAKSFMGQVCETEPTSFFMKLLRIFRWPKESDESILILRGQELIRFGPEKSYGTVNSENQSIRIDLDDMENTIMKYFPNFDPDQLKEALPFAEKITKMTSRID